MRRKTVIFIIAGAAFLISGILLLILIPQTEHEPDEIVPPLQDSEPGTLILSTYLDTDSVDMMPLNGKSYSLQIDRTETEYLKFDLISEDTIFLGMQQIMYTIFSQAITLVHLQPITENANDDQLALYGFNDPVLTWRVNFSNGTSAEFALGSRLAAGTGNYVRNTADRDVFVLDSAAVNILLIDVEYIFDIFFFPFPPSDERYETWSMIDYLRLERPGEATIEMIRRSLDEWLDLPVGHTRYRISQPFTAEGNEQVIRNILMEPVTHITPERILEVKAPDLSIYGLDKPSRLTISAEGWKGTLLIGNRSTEHRGRYVMIEGNDAVLLDPHGDYSFLELDPAQLRTQLTWMHNIDTVSSVVFELEGVIRTLNIDHPASTAGGNLNGRLDDKEIGETNTRRLFASAMSVPSSGGTDTPIPNKTPDYRMTMNFIAGGSQTMEFYGINESEYLMVLDGISLEVFTTRLQIQINLLEKFDILDADEDLPMR